MIDACNICDGPITTPNATGYCDDHLAEMLSVNEHKGSDS